MRGFIFILFSQFHHTVLLFLTTDCSDIASLDNDEINSIVSSLIGYLHQYLLHVLLACHYNNTLHQVHLH